jgi:photosynthesis system II assembly factor YCF48-like protein
MTDPERDQSVERWLRQTPAAGVRSESACLDAETLAAWAEGLLHGPERAAAEAHASGCARCQAMLAVMVRTMPGPPPTPVSALRKWLTMLTPALAAGAAVALWFAVDQRPLPTSVDSLTRDQRAAGQPAESTRSAPAATPGVGGKDASGRALGSLDQEQPKRDTPASELQASKSLDDSFKERRERDERADRDKSPASAALARTRTAAEAKEATDEVLAQKPAASLPRPAPQPAAPATAVADSFQAAAGDRSAQPRLAPQAGQTQNQNQSPNQNQNQTTPRQQAPARVSDTVVVAESPIVAGREAAKKAETSARDFAGGAGFRANAGSFDVVPSDASARWRVVDGRTVQRSLDAGATWANQYSAEDGVVLTAGAAPTSTVCWLVGRGGVIVLTTDGRDWQRVKFPEPVDLTAVTSTDARTATVTTANGRRFLTTNAGRNWTPR